MPVLLRQPVRAMAGVGHEDAFPRPRLSARCRFGQGNFTGTRGNGRDAPKADLLGREPRRFRKRPRQNGWLSQHLLPGVNTLGDDLTGSGSLGTRFSWKKQRL